MGQEAVQQPEQRVLPVLPLRGLTVFPLLTLQFDIGRESSIRAVDAALNSSREIFLVTQRDLTTEIVDFERLYKMGTIATIKQILRLRDNSIRMVVDGISRGRLIEGVSRDPYLTAKVQPIQSQEQTRALTKRQEAAMRTILMMVDHFRQLSDRVSPDLLVRMMDIKDPGHYADCAAQNLPLRFEDKQALLEETRPAGRIALLTKVLNREVEIMQAESDINAKLRDQLQSNQREYYLREQIRVLQKELGDGEDTEEIQDYRHRIEAANLPQAVAEKLNHELDHLKKQPSGSSEAALLRNYLDTCLELPWSVKSEEDIQVSKVEEALNQDHYGLEKVKERILEFVAVKQLSPSLKGQVICLVGPPGVGKTSIAMSVAGAMNRKMARISLGGIRDEADIRGHRKTYIGAMPGRIIAGIRQAGTSNPVLLLDEIDKVGSDGRGDPASALLEVLDGEQNSTFRDHFLEIPFDLSDVIFITTANTTETIAKPLLDRMEVIELPSYTDNEKLQIAKLHLLPRELKRHGMNGKNLKVSDDAIRGIITRYTKEAGVRLLERRIAAICRKAAIEIVRSNKRTVSVGAGDLEKFLGAPKYMDSIPQEEDLVGVVNGLAWTAAGGELLQVEANAVPGTGKLTLTGNLGDVMKESCEAAITFIRSRTTQLGLAPNFYKEQDIHVHFPEGAVPKDGPSAGIAITTAVVSALTGIPVRQDIAMTGEVTLRGRVLPIGGLREKTMAAMRNHISTVLIPQKNVPDLEEIDPMVKAALHFIPVGEADQVLAEALCSQPLASDTAPILNLPSIAGTAPGVPLTQ